MDGSESHDELRKGQRVVVVADFDLVKKIMDAEGGIPAPPR